MEFNSDSINPRSFHDFLKNYVSVKEKNKEVQIFGAMNFSMEGVSIGSHHFFLSQRLKDHETTLFNGFVYMNLTDIAEEILGDISPLNPWERHTALEKALKFDYYPTFFVLSPFKNMHNTYEQHEMLSAKARTILKNISFFYIAPEEIFKSSVEEAYSKTNYLLSPNCERHEELKNGLEGAMNYPLLYDYALNTYGEEEYYEEQAYYLPEENRYYVQAFGGKGTSMVTKGENGLVPGEGFTSFTEGEFVEFVFEKLEKSPTLSFEKIHASPLLHQIINKYRLKRLFEEKQTI